KMLAIHGGPGLFTKGFETEIASLTSLGVDVAWFPQRGLAPSTAPASRDYSLRAHADDIAAVARALDDRPIVIAFSWGALAAIVDRARRARRPRSRREARRSSQLPRRVDRARGLRTLHPHRRSVPRIPDRRDRCLDGCRHRLVETAR